MIRAGILGFGYMGNCHVQMINSLETITVVSAHDIDESKKGAAEAAGFTFYSGRQDFLAQPDLDLVIIATPNQFHRDYAIEALQAGIHVICEKPVTLNTAELDDIIAVSRQTGKLFTVHQNRRWDADYLMLENIFSDGHLGKPIAIESRVLGERGIVFGWRAEPAYGGGMMYDWGVHQIDQILQLMKGRQVVRIFSQLWSVHTPLVDDYFKLELIFDDLTSAHVECGVFSLEKLPRWFVYGDNGTLRINDFSAQSASVSRINHEYEVEVSHGVDPLVGTSRTMAPLRPEQIYHVELPAIEPVDNAFYKNVVLACAGKAELAVSPESVRRTMQVVDAAFLSAETRQSLDVLI